MNAYLPSGESVCQSVDWWTAALDEAATNMARKAGRFSTELSGAAAKINEKMLPLRAVVADIRGSIRVANDSLSIFYNVTAYVHPALLSLASRVSICFLNLSILRSLITFYAGVKVMQQDVVNLSQAYEDKDLESGVAYGLHTGFAAGLLTVAPASLVATIAKLPIAAAVLPAAIAGLVASGAGIALNAFLGLYGIHGLATAKQFINGVKGDSNLEINGMYNNFRDAISNLNQMKRWVGSSGLSELRENLGIDEKADLLKALKDVQDVDKKEKILKIVFEHNYRMQVKYVCFILISALSITAFVAGFVLTGGVANIVFLLFAMSSALWLSCDSESLGRWVGDRVWEWRKEAVLPTDLKRTTICFEDIVLEAEPASA
jgi:hypothetical protein